MREKCQKMFLALFIFRTIAQERQIHKNNKKNYVGVPRFVKKKNLIF